MLLTQPSPQRRPQAQGGGPWQHSWPLPWHRVGSAQPHSVHPAVTGYIVSQQKQVVYLQPKVQQGPVQNALGLKCTCFAFEFTNVNAGRHDDFRPFITQKSLSPSMLFTHMHTCNTHHSLVMLSVPSTIQSTAWALVCHNLDSLLEQQVHQQHQRKLTFNLLCNASRCRGLLIRRQARLVFLTFDAPLRTMLQALGLSQSTTKAKNSSPIFWTSNSPARVPMSEALISAVTGKQHMTN